MTTDGPWWRIGPDGQPKGPYDVDEIRALIERGRILCSDPVWSPVSGQWTPLDRTPLLDGAPPLPPPVLALAAAALAYAAVVGSVVFIGTGDLFDPKNPPSLWGLRFLWIGPALALTLVSVALVRVARRSAARLRPRRLAAGLRMAATCAGIVGGIMAYGSLIDVTTTPQSLIETARARYTVEVVPDTNRIVVSGGIGYGFAQAVQAALDKVADPVRIEIDSTGGLVDEALQVARAIEARPGATVVAGMDCDSACILVLMGGTNRLASEGNFLGFHASSNVRAEAERFIVLGFDLDLYLNEDQADAYLLRRGIPSDIVAESNRRGPQSVYYVAVQTLLERGVLTGLADPPKE